MKFRKSRKRVPVSWVHCRHLWHRIRPDKCHDVQKTIQLMVGSTVNCTVPERSSRRDSIEQIARTASIPISIESLSETLAEPVLPRGSVFFDRLGNVLDHIAMNDPDLYWWMSDKGLNMAIVDPKHDLPDPFDELAGTLTMLHWRDGRLSQESLLEIAAELDKNHFLLKENLQRKEWAAIASQNEKHPRTPIRTFVEAANHKRFSRVVRRSLYRARLKKT